jgi:hypothetical protein
MTPHFFGYGSLVNRATHNYPVAQPARLTGWRRVWRHTATRTVAFLTVVPDANSKIDGLIAGVPRADWAELDKRERHYDRVALTEEQIFQASSYDLQIYRAKPTQSAPPSVRHPILLSYLDVVVQGYLDVFGTSGVEAFFETTEGWDGPVLNDRPAPRYGRHRATTPRERKLTDAHLLSLSAQVQELHETSLAGKG